VISLVQHMYEESSGTVKLDGIEVHELSPMWLSHHVSIVQQEPTLFARSIKRNIMYGLEGTDQEPSQEEIERVARLANCDDFIRKVWQFAIWVQYLSVCSIVLTDIDLALVHRCRCITRQKLGREVSHYQAGRNKGWQ
jgi:ABC-type multidrug transport system fused ATPase/permease subunit